MTDPSLREAIELTFEQRQEIDKFLEGFKVNPSNSNKFRIGLHAYINEILATSLDRATVEALEGVLMKLPTNTTKAHFIPFDNGKIQTFDSSKQHPATDLDAQMLYQIQGYNQGLLECRKIIAATLKAGTPGTSNKRTNDV
jgi:hypothetical protein